MGWFQKDKNESTEFVDFSYLDKDVLYFDSACQTMRPQAVLDSMMEYFHKYNSCGGRVKYEWGRKVDEKIEDTKNSILNYLGKSSSDYAVSFTLNTTTGLNLVLAQLPGGFQKVVTTDIEHNSVFLSTIALERRIAAQRVIVKRNDDGTVDFGDEVFNNKVVFVANNVSNIDGRKLSNLKDGAKKIHEKGGLVIIDAAQGFIYGKESLEKTDFDALAFSGHKIYGPSIGVIVIKKDLLLKLQNTLLGGGMVEDVVADNFVPVKDEQIGSLLELGLQDYAGIIGLNEALAWNKKHSGEHLEKLSDKLYTFLKSEPRVHLVNNIKGSPVISFYCNGIDSHNLAIYLSEQGVMARSGYFCCHYYLKHVKDYPPLLRISLGKNNTEEDVDRLINILQIIIKNIK